MKSKLRVDSFAGGGGTSTGLKRAGLPAQIAINHSALALAMHRINHPNTRHYCENVCDVDPIVLCGGDPVGLFWLSPDCTFHSRARGGKPFRDRNKARRIRGLAGVAIHWAEAVKPDIIMLENVVEFADWGPLLEDGRPCPMRKGHSFRRFVRRLQNLGYKLDWQELRGCDYGAPTTRKRLFLIARCDRMPIVWPEPTHGPGLIPFLTAADCIDWSEPTRSIFGRERALVEATLQRVARGMRRYVLETRTPFIAPITHHGDVRVHDLLEPLRTITTAHRGELALCVPTLVRNGGGAYSLHPLSPVGANGREDALTMAFLAKHYGGHENDGTSLYRPVDTITARDHHSLVTAHFEPGSDHRDDVSNFLARYCGIDLSRKNGGQINIAGTNYTLSDIRMRMLTPRELYTAQGFPPDYIIDRGDWGDPDGPPREIVFTKTEQIELCGNSVCPPIAQALIEANYNTVPQRVPRFATGQLF